MSNHSPRSKAWEQYFRGWPMLCTVPLAIATSFWTYDAIEYCVINWEYGADAWKNGLRIADNKGMLSDGTNLSDFHNRILGFGSFMLWGLVVGITVFGLAYINMRIHGKRPKDFAAE